MRRYLTYIALFLSIPLGAQLDSAAVAVSTPFSSDNDELACCYLHGSLVWMQSAEGNTWLSDQRNPRNLQFDLVYDLQRLNSKAGAVALPINSEMDDGTACFSESDSTLWFSSSRRHAQDKSTSLKLFSCTMGAAGYGEPVYFRYNKPGTSNSHPWITADGETLFFSSNRTGGAGGMDIWYCVRFADGWSQPIWAGKAVNTPGNEVFPTTHKGDLYFSSDGQPGAQGLDLYRAASEAHWRALSPLASGLNSAQDDMQMVFESDSSGVFTSNRDLTNGDDIFAFTLTNKPAEDHGYTAWLQCKNTRVQGQRLDVFDEDGAVVLSQVTAANGALDISRLHVGRSYSAAASGMAPLLTPHTLLFIANPEGVVVQIIPLNGDTFKFELLPGDDLAGSLMANPDNSVLSIQLEGQIYDQIPGDIGHRQAVYIKSPEGELLALAYTQTSGEFLAEDVRPLAEYNISVDEGSRAKHVVVTPETGDQIQLTLQGGNTAFMRLQMEEAVAMLDENANPIQVKKDEVFILKNIYYAFDAHALNSVAQAQLNYLAELMANNPKMGIELSSHTDSRGTDEYNQNLSDQRAQEAIAFLESLGIASSRLTAIGFGESQLISPCPDDKDCSEDAHALNRRTELRLLFR